MFRYSMYPTIGMLLGLLLLSSCNSQQTRTADLLGRVDLAADGVDDGYRDAEWPSEDKSVADLANEDSADAKSWNDTEIADQIPSLDQDLGQEVDQTPADQADSQPIDTTDNADVVPDVPAPDLLSPDGGQLDQDSVEMHDETGTSGDISDAKPEIDLESPDLSQPSDQSVSDLQSTLDQQATVDLKDSQEADTPGPDLTFDPPAPAQPLSTTTIELEHHPKAVISFRFIPGRPGEFLLIQKNGTLRHYQLVGNTATQLGTVALEGLLDWSDCGLLSMAFDPDFANNGFLYLGYCVDGQFSRVSRYRFVPDNIADLPSSGVEVITVGSNKATSAWHNVGALGFDSQGNLWMLFGDKEQAAESQSLKSHLGKVLRVVPNRHPNGTGYSIPADNPFVNTPGALPEIWAYGLRNPWTGAMDSRGRLLIGNVGGWFAEEINVLVKGGENFGWPGDEGLCTFDCQGLVDPLAWYLHTLDGPYFTADPQLSGVEYWAIWVGPEYRPQQTDRYAGSLTGAALFGDFCNGFVRRLVLDAKGELHSDEHVAHLGAVTAITRGDDDYLYAVTFGSCYSWQVEPGTMVRLILKPAD